MKTKNSNHMARSTSKYATIFIERYTFAWRPMGNVRSICINFEINLQSFFAPHFKFPVYFACVSKKAQLEQRIVHLPACPLTHFCILLTCAPSSQTPCTHFSSQFLRATTHLCASLVSCVAIICCAQIDCQCTCILYLHIIYTIISSRKKCRLRNIQTAYRKSLI